MNRTRFFSWLRSIRVRLTLWFGLILAIVLIVTGTLVYARTVQDVRLETLGRLQARIRSLVGGDRMHYFAAAGTGLPSVLSPVDVGRAILQEDEILLLLDNQGKLVSQVGPLNNAQVTSLLASTSPRPTRGGPFVSLIDPAGGGVAGGQQYAFMVAQLNGQGNSYSLLVLGEPLDPLGRLERLRFTLLLVSSLTLLVALSGGYWLASRAMRPVKAITHAAQHISETDLNRRLNLTLPGGSGARDEIGELADTFDQMLARLQAAFERQRQFTADASHDLRTPLSIISLETERALAAPRSAEEYRRALQTICSENAAMSRLVSDMLTLARMDSGQALLHIEPLDLSDLAVEVVERLAPLARGQGVELQAGELPELPVKGDRLQLSQALYNLVENGIKYSAGMTGARVMIEAGLAPAVPGEKSVSREAFVRIQDNGPGVPAEHLPHLFERFYRVDAARSQRFDNESASESTVDMSPTGSGLGLAIVKGIIDVHGGRIVVASIPGQGATFEVFLPLAVD